MTVLCANLVFKMQGAGGPQRTFSVLDRLLLTHPVWLQLSINRDSALYILLREPVGVRPSQLLQTFISLSRYIKHSTEKVSFLLYSPLYCDSRCLQTFLVRKCISSQRKVLCLRVTADKSASSVQECFICEEDSSEYACLTCPRRLP